MQIAVVSDTHGQIQHTIEAIHEIERRRPSLVLHCGDVGNPAVVPLFAGRETRFVFGNVDDPGALRAAIADVGLTCDGFFGELAVDEQRIAFLHGHDERRLREAIDSGAFHLVCHGHTHRRRWERIGTTWVLNPGAIHRATPHSIAFVTLPDLATDFVALPARQT